MAAQLRLLDSDKVTPFVSFSWGNIVSGTISVPKLAFVNSFGDANTPDSECGIEAVAGNDGSTFAEINLAEEMTAAAVTVNGVVSAGGSIPNGTTMEFKVTVKDRWGNESEECPAAYSPAIVADNSKVDLSWTAVTGAFQYTVYANINSGGYKKLISVASNAYIVLTADEGTSSPPSIGAVAYKPGATWGTSALDLGELVPGDAIPVMFRANVPVGISAVGNPRQFKGYVAFTAI